MIRLTATTDETLTFEITSSTRDSTHNVYFDLDNGWVCTCEHHFYRKAECKHIQACKDWLLNNKNYTIIGLSYYKILEYNSSMINYAVNMGTYTEIKKWRQTKCKYPQVMKLNI